MQLNTFIKRPILSCVISVLIVLIGIVGFTSLPVEQYPDIAPPTIDVSTYFYGADAQTIMNSVIMPLEDALNGVENMLYMTSTASNSGEVSTKVIFKQGTNPDMASVNVQNRVQKAMSQLPAEVKKEGVTVEKSQNSMLQIISVYSPEGTYDYEFLCNYADINIKPRVMLINGVGKFQMMGSEYAIRIWMNPGAMKQHNLSPDDIAAALSSQNLEAATGTFGQDSDESFQYTMKYTGRLKSVEQFKKIVLRSDERGNVLRLGDVAKVELGIKTYNFNGYTNGQPGAMCIAYQAAGSNATQVNEEISEVVRTVKKDAPGGIEIATLMNTNDFLYAAIEQVADTLRDAIILVILIVLLFLKDFKSTVIPFISIMVSLIGTFAFMMIAGFSVNLLTLFALVLVIGTVVDDSIVVVEAVHAQFGAGNLDPYKATKAAVKEVALPVLTSSIVFMAVFIPVSMMGGTSGVFYRQFGLTMAVAVGISALNALTTVPALCAMMLKPIQKPVEGQKMNLKQRYSVWFDKVFANFTAKYKAFLDKTMGKKPVIWLVIAAGAAVLLFSLSTMPKGLVPNEDKGMLIIEMGLPAGTSIHGTSLVSGPLSEDISKIEGVADISVTNGYGFVAGMSPNSALLIIKLDDWSERGKGKTMDDIAAKMNEVCANYKEANCIVFTTPMIPGYGTSNDIEMYVQDRRGAGVEELSKVTDEFIAKLAEKGVNGFSAFKMDYPQWEVSVDAARCLKAGVTPQEVLNTMGMYYGGSYASDLNLYGKVYKVMMQSDADYRRDETSLSTTYIKMKNGEMAPVGSFVSIRRVYGPDAIKTFNKFTAINVNVSSDMGTGKTLEVLQQCADQYLPEGYTIDFAGMAREQKSQGGLGSILLICVFLIYLILAALYESLVIPFAVLLAVPLGLAASFGISSLAGLDNNIYLQTGVIMLIGLLSKTAILITEYSVDRHKKGMEIKQAALEAAEARLRPIIMTVATMAIGLVPLVTSLNGVGGHGNFSLGLGTIVGIVVGTVGLLFITPVLYTTFQTIQDKIKPNNEDDDDDED